MPHESAAVSARSVYIIQMHHVTSCKFHVLSTCHLHFWQNDRDLLRATAVTRAFNAQEVDPVPAADSNTRPFNHEFGALTTAIPAPISFFPFTVFLTRVRLSLEKGVRYRGNWLCTVPKSIEFKVLPASDLVKHTVNIWKSGF